MKINNFRGDLTDASAKKEPLPCATASDFISAGTSVRPPQKIVYFKKIYTGSEYPKRSSCEIGDKITDTN